MNYLNALQPLNEFNQTLQAQVRPIDWINPKPQGRYNLVVIGAGTAGLVTAAGAAGLGAKVALIERGLMGGDCLNVGCVPSKALIAAARCLAATRDRGDFGIQDSQADFDFAAMMQRMRMLRASISPNDSARRFKELGVDVFFGQGTFTGGDSIEVAGQSLRFKRAVIATGARASVPDIPGLKELDYFTNETLFSITELPQRMIVIGGGPIGCEMAQAFARFGSSVTLIESSKHILSREEPDAAQLVQTALCHDGVEILLEAKVVRADRDGERMRLTAEQSGKQRQILGDVVLVATGRTPNVDGLDLDRVGVRHDPIGGIEVNDFLQTANSKIYAAGDVCSKYQFTHAADFLARTVVQNALFMGRMKASRLLIPWCTYTSPELAHVGLYPADAADAGFELVTYSQPFSSNDRAILEGTSEGFVRVYCRKGRNKILGATIVTPHAGDLMGELVLAMRNGIGLSKIASTIHPYPTYAESIRRLGDQYNRTRLTPGVKALFEKWLAWNR